MAIAYSNIADKWTVASNNSWIYSNKVTDTLTGGVVGYGVNRNGDYFGGVGVDYGTGGSASVIYGINGVETNNIYGYKLPHEDIKYTTLGEYQFNCTPTAGQYYSNVVFNNSITIDSRAVYNIENCVFVNNFNTGLINEWTVTPDGFSAVPTKRAKLRMNLVPVIRSRANPVIAAGNESVALETLHQIVTETEFRKYLKYGFVLVKGASGATYQIFRNKSHTRVFVGGKLVEEICVRIKDAAVPPTDNVIAFLTMISAGDEEAFKKCGNVYRMAA